jgi:hypothetical protein
VVGSLGTQAVFLAHSAEVPSSAPVVTSSKATGYRGIWFELGQKSQFGDKYSGGLATYTANHVPMAIYSPAVKKTFFVYGGTMPGKRHLLAMASYYDHVRHRLPRPTIVHDKQGVNDPHDNPSLCLDGEGFLWVFVSGRARQRPGLIYRSVQPYSTDSFRLVAKREFTYPQPRWIPGHGFLFLFTKYTKGRELYFSTSPDGSNWSPDVKFVGMGGHYQTSHQVGTTVFTAFNRHPGGSVDKRTDLFYLQTDDFGQTWKSAAGEVVPLPLAQPVGPALVRNYEAEQELVYIHDLDWDEAGRPVILYITSRHHQPGPAGNPRWWTIARWAGTTWEYSQVLPANHNYSTGSLHLDHGNWRILGPTDSGPQPVGAGGEIAIWTSSDSGMQWRRARSVTKASPFNHNYVRRVLHGHSDFFAFWADGHPDAFSTSSLYFMNQAGTRVWRMPGEIQGDFCEPERAFR